MLEVSRLDAVRSDSSEQQLFSNLTFSVRPGQWCWVKGSNGSGKSTLLKQLTGLLPTNIGSELKWKGENLSRFETTFLQDLLYLGHKPALHPALTSVENIKWLTSIRMMSSLKKRGLDEYPLSENPLSERPLGEGTLNEKPLGDSNDITHVLTAHLHQMGVIQTDIPCEQLSFGQRQRVALTQLLLCLGKLWILDEPSTGLDEAGQQCLEHCLQKHLMLGGSAVIASHIRFQNVIPPHNIIELKTPEINCNM